MGNSAISYQDLDLVRRLYPGVQSAKLLRIESCQHNSLDAARLRAVGVQNIVVRGPDTRMSDGRYPSPEEYASYFVGVVNEFYHAGVRLFQLGNEDQYLWDKIDYGPWQLQQFLRNVLPIVRRSVPQDVKLISPPLSFSPALWRHGPQNPTAWVLDDWFAAFQWTDAQRKPMLWQLFDFCGANVYWQTVNQMRDPSFGMSYRQLHERSGGMPVVICEYGCSAHEMFRPDGQRRYTDAEVDAMRCEMYPAWLQDAADLGFVQSAHAFLLGGTQDWVGYRITETVGEALKAFATPQVNL